MKASNEWQQCFGRAAGSQGGGSDSNDKDAAKPPSAAAVKVIEIDDSSDSDEKPTAAVGTNEPIYLDASSENSAEAPTNDNVNAPATLLPKANRGKRQKQRKEKKTRQGKKRRKNAAAQVFKVDSSDPFLASGRSVHFVVRGKPRPQYRDKPGLNWTRYNPSKRLQSQFCNLAVEQCLTHVGQVPNFGSNALLKVEVHFRFPMPKTGLLKNTADIDNLSKFILDACNGTFYGDDGQVVTLLADKGYDESYGGEGYTLLKIELAA